MESNQGRTYNGSLYFLRGVCWRDEPKTQCSMRKLILRFKFKITQWYRKASSSLERNYGTRVSPGECPPFMLILRLHAAYINEQSRWISKAQLAAQPRDLQRSYGGAGFRWWWQPPEWRENGIQDREHRNTSTKCKTECWRMLGSVVLILCFVDKLFLSRLLQLSQYFYMYFCW